MEPNYFDNLQLRIEYFLFHLFFITRIFIILIEFSFGFIIQLIASIFGISYFIWRKIKAKYSNTPDFQVFINLDEEKKEQL